jgi:hypothetical protein
MFDQTIHHGVSRNVKRISVIACVFAAGESLMPYIVTSRNSSIVQEHLREQHARFRRDMISKDNQRPYVNAGNFLDYIRAVFLSYIDAFRGLVEFAAENAVLFVDNVWAHVTDDAIHLLIETRVFVLTFAPHTTQIFQVLGLTLLGFLKRHLGYDVPFENDNAAVKLIMKVCVYLTLTRGQSHVNFYSMQKS